MKQWCLFLCLRYLSRKRIVLLSITAVMLCCALLITVASLFTGFIRAVEDSVGEYLGDLVLSAPRGKQIEDYSLLLTRLEALPDVEAATPVLGGNGLLVTGPGQVRDAQVVGIDLASRLRVSPLKDALLVQKDKPADQITFTVSEPDSQDAAGGFVGIGLIADPDESTDAYNMQEVYSCIGRKVALTTGKLAEEPDKKTDQSQASGPKLLRKVLRFTIADVVQTGAHDFDEKFVYVPINTLSTLLYPDKKSCADEIQIRLRPGAREDLVMAMVRGLWMDFARERFVWADGVSVESSRQRQADMIAEYRKQLNLLMIIFGIVSVGVGLLVFCIFYLIVMTKQKDIAVVKSCGASSVSVAGLYLLFGIYNGIVGSVLGAILGWIITRNIQIVENAVSALIGIKIWKASTYLFSKMPNEVNWQWAFWICVVAMSAAALGALVPAIVAARIRPVKLLRYE